MSERYYIGIDGGGSHCKGVLISESGRLAGSAAAGPCSKIGTPFEVSCANLKHVICELVSLCGDGHDICGLYAGVSGCGAVENARPFVAFLHKEFPEFPFAKIGSDVLNPLYATIGDADGIIAICGTGSGAYARIQGEMYRVDLDGYILGDEAGGFSIGRNVLNSALKMQDGRLKKTLLYDLCVKRLGGGVRENIIHICDGGKQYIASFAPLAFESMQAGDMIAKSILDRAVESVTDDILTAARHFPSVTGKIPVVISGSLWKPADRYFEREVASRIGPRFEIKVPSVDPAFGAAVYGATLVGYKVRQL